MKTPKTSHKYVYPLHWHGSIAVAIAAILLTSLKSSGDMLRALQAVPVRADVIDTVYLRDETETGHTPIILNDARSVTLSGR